MFSIIVLIFYIFYSYFSIKRLEEKNEEIQTHVDFLIDELFKLKVKNYDIDEVLD